MLDILIVADCPYSVTLRGTGLTLTRTNEPLRPGDYDLKPDSPGGLISVTDEPHILRVLSHTVSGRDNRFRHLVRERDGKCVITGLVNTDADIGDWTIFEAAHVFPVTHEEYFRNQGFSRWITNRAGEHDIGINSCQNVLLMQSNVHQLFDSFKFSINPEDNYKIVSFDSDLLGLDGRVLDSVCRDPNDERSVRDELLRWHFRQAVLANMRAAGESVLEFDFPPGTDMVGEILSGPDAAKRMEAELFSRLDQISPT
ncbi:HNH endonuclease-domain-containing protein [Lipomyces tetrasporus]|uniref:HNH endonuclease-domain-containing protein n=1 Tax=Lipomyces tetrasporus TaxID=54092 RepID=A0AAD7QRE6_9ASCO|nr:HNH endonuclease-domain-containing protein [Lipomyces tetrasporus]KAJ8100167.1 HNH endonuclease-domain-containing protein [Lipomyces tetrasporus]